MEIEKAIEELKSEKKRKFTQTVDLIVNLQKFDVRKESINVFINIPHPTEKKIAAFLTKKSNVIDTITENDFQRYNDLKEMKKLAKEYDSFIAIAPMMSKVATKFGRVFGPMGKMPSPQAGIIPKDDDETVKAMVEKMKNMHRVRTKELSVKIPVGKEDMEKEKIKENIQSILKQLESRLPRGKDCIKDVMLKMTMTKAIKIMDYNKKKK